MPILPQLPMWRNRDVPAGVIIGWPSTNATIPVGWVRETSLDGVFPKQIPTSSTAPGSTGGATTHAHVFSAHSNHTTTHTHAGSWGTSPAWTNNAKQNGLATTLTPSHSHTSSAGGPSSTGVGANASPANTDTFANDPLHVTQVFIRSTGTATGIPVSGLVWYNGAAPTGFSVYASLDLRFMKGAAAAGDGGAQAGTDPSSHTHTTATHTHSLNAHTHTVSLDADNSTSNLNSPNVAADAQPHTHALGVSTSHSGATSDAASETTGVADGNPAWHKLRAVQKTVSPGITTGVICMWLGSLSAIPTKWRLCDGGAGTPNLCTGRFVMAANSDVSVGTTGGGTTHTHAASAGHAHGTTGAGTHQHTFTGASGISSNTGGSVTTNAGAQGWAQSHSHASATYTAPATSYGTLSSVATTQNANTSNNPPYAEVAYIQKIA